MIAAVLFAGSMMATEVTVSKTVEELATANSWENGNVVTPFALDEVITVSTEASDANTGKYYTSGQQVRLYQTGAAKLIVTAAEGYTISSITLTYVSQNTGIFVEAESGVAVDFENVQSATFTVGNSGEATNGQARVTAISVTYNGEGGVTPPAVATPVISGDETFTESVIVTITCSTPEADIYYTTDGTTDPKCDCPAAPEYTQQIVLTETTTIMAAAYTGNDWSAVATKTFTKVEPLPEPTDCATAAAAALSVSANNELYNDGAVYTIQGYVTSIKTAYSDQYHNISFWMADTQEGGEVLQAYRAACASEEDAPQVGDKVAVTGSLTKYGTTPEFAAGCTFEIIGDDPVEEHTYTVAGSPAAVFGEEWKPALEANDMQPIVGGEYTHSWQKENVTLAAGKVEFKVVTDHDWANPAYPAYEAGNYELTISEDAIYTISIFFNEETKEISANALKTGDAPVVPTEDVIYDWAGEIGTTILGASGVEVSTVKIHTNTETVPAIKFGSSYVYADGKWIAIKPAEGGFKAGDVLSVAAVYSNDATDGSKYAQVDVYAADGETRLFRGDSVVNGKKSADDPVVENYVLEADQDSLLLGRYGNTGMFVTMLKVVREGGDVPPVEEHTYTVAGSSAELFGTAWTPSIEDNDMAKQEDGSYKFEKTELELAAGIIEFKVCEDHAWTNCWPAQNYQLSIAESGIYTITITFNAETKEVAAVATKTGEAVVIPSVAMHGNFLGSWADTENFAIAQDNASASLTLTLAEGNYEFGMRIGGSGNWTANGANLTREANTTNLAEGQGNMHIAADVAGDYVFTYTYETQILEVVYPEAPVVPDTITIDIESEVVYTDMVAAQGWWQFMAENDEYEISLSNVSTTQAAGVYTVADLDQDYTYIEIKATETEVHFVDGSLTLTEGEDGSRTIEGVMTGNDGNIYNIKLVFRIPTAETTVNVEISNWGIADASQYYGWAGYIFYGEAADGTYVQIVIPGTNPVGQFTYDDVYAGGTGIEVGGDYQNIYSMNVTVNVSDAGRAIITADILCYNNTLYHVTTIVGEGVDNIDAAVKAIKRIVNGQVVIEKAGKTYNMNGAVIR